MKVKKINTVAAAVLITGVITMASFFGYVWSSSSALIGNAPPAMSALTRAHGEAGSILQESAADRDVIEIGWKSFQNDMPDDTSLTKWEDGDRIYYQVSGPVNEGTIHEGNIGHYADHHRWGDSVEVEVFFDRGGGKYDQWMINPKSAANHHFAGYYQFRSSSVLPKSRYSCQIKGGNLVTTFWTHKDDAPGNIVFNYILKSGGNVDKNLAWATTGTTQSGHGGEHHKIANWTNP